MKTLMVILAMVVGSLFMACTENSIEPIEIPITEQYTRIISRDGFWVWDSTYAEEYIQFEDSLYLGYNKTLHLYYHKDKTFRVTFMYERDGMKIRESFSEIYQWSIIEIEKNVEWGIEYILPDIGVTIISIVSLDKKKLNFGYRTYEYVESN